MAGKTKTDATEALKQVTYLASALKAPRITEAAARLADHARDAGWTHEEYLAAILDRADAHTSPFSSQNPRRDILKYQTFFRLYAQICRHLQIDIRRRFSCRHLTGSCHHTEIGTDFQRIQHSCYHILCIARRNSHADSFFL